MQKISWQYLAGFIDGEGSIGTTRTGKHRNVVGRLIIANTHQGILHMLKAQFGGSITVSKKVRGEGWHPFAAISWTNRGALTVLEGVLPYLILKQVQAEVCIQLIRMRDVPKNERYDYVLSPARGFSKRTIPQIKPKVAARELGLAETLNMLNRKGTTKVIPLAEVVA